VWCRAQKRKAVGKREIAGAGEFWRRIGFEPDALQRELLEGPRRRVILNCSRQWGKSTVAAARAVEQAQTHAGSLTLVLSPSGRQSGEFLKKAEEFVRRLGVRPRGDGRNEISVQFPNGSRIVGLPGSERTVRGFSAVDLLLVDEASRVEDDLYKAVRPMLAVTDGDLWLMSTPHGKRGFFHQEWEYGGEEWRRVSAPATECARIRPEFLEEERRVQGDRWFRQEYMCEFVEAEDGVFGYEDVMAMIDYSIDPLPRMDTDER
jgi:hypothetical protein